MAVVPWLVALTFGYPAQAATPERVEVVHRGRDRLALVHVPGGRPIQATDAPRPVVIAFHGGGGNAEHFRQYAGLDVVADREGFIVVYPEGLSRPGLLSRRLHTWNSGSCCGYANSEDTDDVGFVVALLDRLSARLPIDPRRTYATGHSNGAMMAYRLAAEAPGRVAAIAPVGGAMLLDDFPLERPVPVLHVHSVDDPRALYHGGEGPPFPFTRARITHNAVEEQLGRWVRLNGCAAEPRVVETRSAPGGRSDTGHTAERLSWSPCTTGANVELWRLAGAGHGWPGPTSLAARRGFARRRMIGPPSAVIDAAEEAWRFFQQHERDPHDTGRALTGPAE